MTADDVTDPLQTIVSLLKNSSTGIGTSGYEITNDAGTGLTISNGDILVSYTMAREELRSQLGGDQDFDVIITCDRSKLMEEEWIGFSTKMQKVKVVLIVNVIDKWSGTGSSKRTITADLVRYKAENAIRKFIKDKTNAPGGSMGIWKFNNAKNEEDTSLKPTLFKVVIETEVLIFYNPTSSFSINLESDDINDFNENRGQIRWIAGTEFRDLPDSLTATTGTYVIEYSPEGTDEFVKWEVEGLITVEDENNSETNAIVSGNGTLRAIYRTFPIDNGDFETGSLPPWEDEEVIDECGSCSMIVEDPYEGTYAAEVANSGNAKLRQTLGLQLLVSQIGVWTIESKTYVGSGSAWLGIEIIYTDGSTFWEESVNEAWKEIDLAAHLETGKTVTAIRFSCALLSYIRIDRCQLFGVGGTPP